MTPIKYNKLVRDRIPEIIKQDGWEPTVLMLGQEAHVKALRAKLLEEISEYTNGENSGELIDILECVLCLAGVVHNLHVDELMQMARAKRESRGSLLTGAFLLEIAHKDV